MDKFRKPDAVERSTDKRLKQLRKIIIVFQDSLDVSKYRFFDQSTNGNTKVHDKKSKKVSKVHVVIEKDYFDDS